MALDTLEAVLDELPSNDEWPTFVETMKDGLLCMLQPNPSSSIMESAKERKGFKAIDQIPDRCDGCGCLGSDSTLRRCSRCKIARYCSSD